MGKQVKGDNYGFEEEIIDDKKPKNDYGFVEEPVKKKGGSVGSSTTGLDLSPAANYRQSLSDFNSKAKELEEIQGNLTNTKKLIDQHDVLQQDPTQLEIFKANQKQYNDLVKVNNQKVGELKRLKVLLDQNKKVYDEDNFNRQEKLFKQLGLNKKDTQELRNKIYKQLHPERAEDIDAGTFVPTSIDVDADDLSKAITGQTTDEIDRKDQIERNRPISDRIFGTFARSVEKTLAFELPASVGGTVQNLLSEFKITEKDLDKSVFRPGVGHQIKKAINLIPGAKTAINNQVDDARVAAFEWADNWRKQPNVVLPGVLGSPVMLENDMNLIRSISQINKPLDVIDFVFSNAGQGVAQILPSIATRGTTSIIQEIGNNQLDGTIEIAKKLTKELPLEDQMNGKVVTPEEVIRKELDEPVIARNFGIIQGALDALSANNVVKALGYENVKKDLKQRALRWFEDARRAGTSEFFTEGTQSALSQTAIGKMTGLGTVEAVKKIDWFQVLDESIAGAIGGVAVSTGGNTMKAAANRLASIAELAKNKNKTEDERAVYEELMNDIASNAKKQGDPRPEAEIKKFVEKEVLPNIPSPTATPKVDIPAPSGEPRSTIPVEELKTGLVEQYQETNKQEKIPVTPKERIIAEHLGRFSKESFGRFGDPNFMKDTPVSRMMYLSKKGRDIDVQAKEMSEIFNPEGDGTEISPQDIIDFVMKFPKGKREFRSLAKEDTDEIASQAIDELADDYFENRPGLRYALESIMKFGLTPENLQSPEVQEYLNNSFLFSDEDKENINTIFEYAKEEGLHELNQLLVEINEQTGREFEQERQIPEVQTELAGEEAKVNTAGFPASWGSPQQSTNPETKANPPTESQNSVDIEDEISLLETKPKGVRIYSDKVGNLYEAIPTNKSHSGNFDIYKNGKMLDNGAAKISDIKQVIALEIRTEKSLAEYEASKQVKQIKKGSTPRVKKSVQVKAELDDLIKELDQTLGNTLATGINPQAAIIGGKIIAKYVELGVVKFSEIAQDVYDQYGEEAFRKFFQSLKAGYGSLLATSDDENLTPLDELKKSKPEDFIQNTDADDTSTAGSLESDSSRDDAGKQVGTKDVSAKRAASGTSAGTGSKGTGKPGLGAQGDLGFSERIPAVSSEPPDPRMDREEQPEPVDERIEGREFSGRSTGTDESGLSSNVGTETEPAKTASKQVTKRLTFEEKVKLQERANRTVKIVLKDKANIAESLPLLLEHQVDNVFKAENRFHNPPAENGVNKGIMFTDGTGTGKAQPLDAKILTPTGWKLMGDIKVGDAVIGRDGHSINVVGVYPQGKKKIYRVTFSDGSETKCCDEHLWLTQSLYERRKFNSHPNAPFCQPKVRQLSEIRSTLDKHYFIPIVKPVHFSNCYDPIIPAYTLGVILGDGCITQKSITITSIDPQVISHIKAEISSRYLVQKIKTGERAPAYRISDMDQANGPFGRRKPHGYKVALSNFGLDGCYSHEKFIPHQYLFGSIETRLAVLQGLMDTDGTVDKRTGCASFCSTSKQLAKDLIFIVQSLGGTGSLSSKKTAGKMAFIVHVNLPFQYNPFRLTRKISRYTPAMKYFPRRRIVSVEFDGLQEAQCIVVDSPDHLYVTDDCIVTHNTFTGLGIALRQLRNGVKDQLIVVPTDAKVKDWIAEGKYFGLDLYQLKDTKDAGKEGSIVITTYANFRQNPALISRANKKPFGLVQYDESHKIVSNESGEFTQADSIHKLITNSPNQAMMKARAKYQTLIDRDMKDLHHVSPKTWDLISAEQKKLVEATKVVFLSASPFSYHKNLEYADGYLFTIKEGEKDSSASYRNFFIGNFGYRIRYNKLTEPEASVDVGLMERAFHTRLVKAGAVSSTRLQLDKDYSREFILVDDKAGMLIDEGYKIASDEKTYPILSKIISRKFSFLYENQLLEAIKAKQVIARVQQHLDLGRKVVIFHSYNNSFPTHPFDFSDPILYPNDVPMNKINAEIMSFHTKYPQYKNLDLSDLKNPIKTFVEAFGDKVALFNGNVPAKQRSEVKRLFNKDDSGIDIIVVQMEAGKEGLSLHDLTGKRQRVMINVGLPTKPTDAIQTEGRIYRIGQMSDAIIEYPVLHLNFEKSAFANKINERAKTAENLAFGEQARNLKEAFKEGYKSPITEPPHTKQGTGTRDTDLQFERIDEWDMSKTLYFGRQKRNAKTKAREGADYYATPEPLGLKMVEWLYPKANDHLLEPSAGHGAIARWFPENTVNKMIEPSYDLKADLAINAQGIIEPGTFEDHHIVNKYDGIAMNPPFGHASKTAWDHIEKAMGHLKNGGRVIAILPEGPSSEKYITKWQESKESKDFFITAKISLPSIAFDRAGTNVKTQILVIDKQTQEEVRKRMPLRRDIDLSYIDDIKQFFDELKDIEMPEKIKPVDEATNKVLDILKTGQLPGDTAQVITGIHTKYGYKIHTVRLTKEISYEDFTKANNKAKSWNGYYSNYNGNGAIRGFIFKDANNGKIYADKLADYINGGFNDDPINPTDGSSKGEAYSMMSHNSKSRTVLAEFQGRPVNQKGEPFKLYNSVINLAKKYNPGSTLGQGHNTRGSFGTFYNPSRNVRVSGLNDLSVAMHELTHALDYRNGIIKTILDTSKVDDKVRSRLTDLYLKYYPGAQENHSLRMRMVEGFATLIEKYLTIPTDIEQNFGDLVRDFLTPGGKFWTDETGYFLQDVKEIIQQYQALDPLMKFGARITNDVIDQNNEQFLTTADKITAQLFDKLYPIEKLAKVNGTHFTQDDISLWTRLSNNALQIAEKNISSKKQRFWQMDAKGQWSEKHKFNYYTLTRSLDRRGLQEEFAAYLYARRIKAEYDESNRLQKELDEVNSPEYLEQVMKSMDVEIETARRIVEAKAQEIEQEINRLASILDNEGISEQEANEAHTAGKDLFAEDEKMYDTLVAEDLEFAHNPLVQLLDDEGYEKFTAHEGYATFKRAFYDELVGTENVPLIQTAGKTKVSQFLTRRGSTKAVLNPLMGAMMNHSELIRKGLRQMVYNKFLKVAEQHPDMFQVLQLQVNDDSKNRFPQEKDPNIIMARKGYKRVPILADSQIKSVLDENYDYHNAHLLERVGVTASQMFRTGTTGIFWQFFLNNTLLDQLAASVNTRNGMWPFISSVKQVGPAALNMLSEKIWGRATLFPNSVEASYLKEYLFLAGTSQTFLSADIEGVKHLSEIIRNEDKNFLSRLQRYFETFVKWLSTPGNATEIMTRGTEYILARKAGKPQHVALEEAGRVSAPFHHIGKHFGGVGRSYVRTVPYFNASLQVLKQTRDSLNTKEGKIRYAFTALSMVAFSTGTMLYLLDGDDDDERLQTLKSLPPDNLTKYLFIPNPYSNKQLIQIRIPEQLGWLAGLFNMMLLESKGQTNYKWSEYGEAAASFMPTQLNPFNPTQMLFSYVPQVIKPTIETATGVKTYPSVRPIETAKDRSLPPELRYSKYTTPGAIFLGEQLGWSPKKIDNFITGQFGRASKYVMDPEKAVTVGDIFNRELYLQASRQVQLFYETKQRVAQQVKAHEEGRKQYSQEEIQKMWRLDALVFDIEGLLQGYQDAEESNDPLLAVKRNMVFRKLKELESEAY